MQKLVTVSVTGERDRRFRTGFGPVWGFRLSWAEPIAECSMAWPATADMQIWCMILFKLSMSLPLLQLPLGIALLLPVALFRTAAL